MNSMNILIVEDNNDMYEAYADSVADFADKDFEIVLSREKSVDAAINALLSTQFDGAIVDLNLDKTTPAEAGGNKVLREILALHRFPVLVVSANLQNLDHDIQSGESEFLKFMDRDTSNSEIFSHLIGIYKTGITKILGGKGLIEKQLGDIFWAHLASAFHNFPPDSTISEKILLRYIASHLAEYLDIPDGHHGFYHEAEVYIKPPIRKHISTGDMILRNGQRFVVLSPACDIAVRGNLGEALKINSKMIVLAPIIEVNKESFIQSSIIKEGASAREKVNALGEIIKGKRDKYGFLPKYDDIEPAIIDFQNITSVSLDDFIASKRLVTISSLFMKDIQSRFAAYLGRQGQPDLDKAKLVEEYKTLLD